MAAFTLLMCLMLSTGVYSASIPTIHRLLYQNTTANAPFSWRSCGSPTDMAMVRRLSISPMPLHIPGPMTVSFDITLKQDLTSPVKAEVVMEKKVGFLWMKLPCMSDIGSCTYDDMCPILGQIAPIMCPIPAGEYSIPPTPLQLPSVSLPPFLAQGDYRINIKMQDSGKQVTCLNIQLSLK